MAAALDLWLELEVEETGEFGFDPGGLDLPSGRDNLIVRAFESLHSADGIAFRLTQAVPLGRGLGSSAAAIVAGLAAADHLYELALSQRGAAGAGERDRGPSRQRRRGDLRRLRRLRQGRGRRSRRRPFRSAGRSRGNRRDPARGGADRARPRGDPGRGAARRRRGQRRRRLAARARPAAAPTSTFSPPASPTASTRSAAASSTRARWSWSTRPRELGALGATISGAGPTVLVWTTWQDAGKVSGQLERRCEGWAEVRRLPFTPHGADVPEL